MVDGSALPCERLFSLRFLPVLKDSRFSVLPATSSFWRHSTSSFAPSWFLLVGHHLRSLTVPTFFAANL